MDNAKYYLKVGRASDLSDKKERIIYRILEILPGFLVWFTLISVTVLSWLRPVFIAYFIILFCFYWLLRISHFSLHLIVSYRQVKKNLKNDWAAKLDEWNVSEAKNADIPLIQDWKEIYHLVIFPMYKESFSLIEETFQSLADSKYPKEKIIVVLGVEERAGSRAKEAAEAISKKFGGLFHRFLITYHPQNLAGEIPGKGSNETWAAREAKEKIIDKEKISYENIIVSTLDIDTQVYPQYFSCLAYQYLTCARPTRSSFQPIPLYLNNIWEVPFFSRVVAFSNVFWQALQQQRPEKLVTFSSHAMSFKAAAEMDFWQTNVVSEDAGIFWKSYLFYDGDYRIVPLHYPVSMDCVKNKSVKDTVVSQYKQQRRWAWGSEGIPYLLFGFMKNKKIPLRSKFRYGFLLVEGFWAWGTNAILILSGWMPLTLGGEAFGSTMLAYNLPIFTGRLMNIALLGLFICAFISFRMLSFRPFPKNFFKIFLSFFQWIFIPLTLIVFGAIPSIEAQTRLMLGKYLGFYATEKIREKKKEPNYFQKKESLV